MGVIERPRVTRDVSRRRPTGRVRTQRGYTTMANRRKFLAGLGALASGSAAAVGTGAFSNVQANRNVSIEVAGDQSAYLTMESTSEYASSPEDGILSLDFGTTTTGGGTGLNNDAITSIDSVFKFKNGGTQPIAIYMDDGRPWAPDRDDLSDGYWAEDANLFQKIRDIMDTSQLYDVPEDVPNNYNFSAGEGKGEVLNQFLAAGGGWTTQNDFRPVAPNLINLDQFEYDSSNYGAILDAGEEVEVSFYINTDKFYPEEIDDGKVHIWAYSEDYAESVQE